MSFAKSERDYPEGKYIHTECKWCGCSYIGPKHENACKKCDDTLQRMGGFIKPENMRHQTNEQRLRAALLENIDKFDISDDGQIIMKAQPKKSRVTLGAKLFMVSVYVGLIATSIIIYREALL